MKQMLLIAFGCLALCACKKHEVDISALTTNPFDPDWRGDSFLHVDSVRTFPIGAGFVHQQRLYLGLPAQLRQQQDYSIRLIDLDVPDTTYFPAGDPSVVTAVILNQQVTLGTEYCFHIDIVMGGILSNHHIEPCAIAEL